MLHVTIATATATAVHIVKGLFYAICYSENIMFSEKKNITKEFCILRYFAYLHKHIHTYTYMCLQKIDLLSVNKEHLIHWFVYPNTNISFLMSQ